MVRLGAGEAAERCLHRLLQRQPLAYVEHRRVAHLDVAHAIARCVFGELVGDALQRRLGLHDRERDREALEVILEVARIVHRHVLTQGGRVSRRHRAVVLGGQIQHRLRSQRAVEVAV